MGHRIVCQCVSLCFWILLLLPPPPPPPPLILLLPPPPPLSLSSLLPSSLSLPLLRTLQVIIILPQLSLSPSLSSYLPFSLPTLTHSLSLYLSLYLSLSISLYLSASLPLFVFLLFLYYYFKPHLTAKSLSGIFKVIILFVAACFVGYFVSIELSVVKSVCQIGLVADSADAIQHAIQTTSSKPSHSNH